MLVKDNADRISRLGNVLLEISGKQGDSFRLGLYVRERSKFLSEMYRTEITPRLVETTARTMLHQSIRRKQMECSSIVAGCRESITELFCVDPYGASVKDNFVVTGYGLYFLFGIYDEYYREDMSEEEAHQFLERCLNALKEHLYIKANKWILKSLSVQGEFGVKNIEM